MLLSRKWSEGALHSSFILLPFAMSQSFPAYFSTLTFWLLKLEKEKKNIKINQKPEVDLTQAVQE